MKSKKGYTLFEIVIVLGIIIILMTVTMRFSGSRIDMLKSQTDKDDFKNNYDQLLLGNMSSNYYNGKRYGSMEIQILSGGNGITYNTKDDSMEISSYTGFSSQNFEIIQTSIDNEDQSELNIQLIPYKIGCKINNKDNSEATIKIKANNQEHCFKITTEMCKSESIICK